jgi:hypothetical protein
VSNEPSADDGQAITRRRFLGGIAATSIAGTAGCIGSGASAEFTSGADVFEVVYFTHSGPSVPLAGYEAEIRLKKSFDEPVTYLVCVHEDRQYTAGRIGTGSTTAEFDVPSGESTILAVQGGRTEDGKVLGGTVAARGTLEVSR